MRYLIVVIFLFVSSTAFARPLNCGTHDKMVYQLTHIFKETKIGMGLNSDGLLVEMFASKLGSFTILTTGTTKRSCVSYIGKHWETLNKHWSVKPF